MAKTNTVAKVAINEVVGSSTIKGYAQKGITESTTGTLFVEFNSGHTYKYADVGYKILQEFINADSKGKYFSANIRNAFKSEKVE